ncbi:MAG: hypothetical protein EOO03_10450, partial [Chitinophagaceae bacterium]
PTTSSISIPGTEAQKALDRVSELFPDAGKGSGRVVFATHNGTTIPESNDKITAVISELSKLDDVSRVVSPFENTAAISSDKTIAYAQVQLKNEAGSVPEDTITKIESILAAARSDNLVIYSAIMSYCSSVVSSHIIGNRSFLSGRCGRGWWSVRTLVCLFASGEKKRHEQ